MSDDLTATRDRVVHFHYELRDANGNVAETSRSDAHPAAALMGHGNLMPGLESALEGKREGDVFEAVIPPEDAFGERREGLTERVSKKYVAGGARLKAGAVTTVQTGDGPRAVTVLKVGGKFVDVDLNHPMAGESVTIAVEVIGVREATEEEIAHRHAHGAGGHQH